MVENCKNCAHRDWDRCLFSGYYCAVTRRGTKGMCDWKQKESLKLNHVGWLTIGVAIGFILGFLIC